jgi:predicted amidohydrolase
VKVALAQIETRVGAIARNEDRIVRATHEAKAKGAELVLFPELAVTGYPPRDLLFREEFVREAARATARIAARTQGITVVLGSVEPGKRKLRNVACVLEGGRVKETRAKTLLPSYSVFMEERWFEPGSLNGPLELMGVGVGWSSARTSGTRRTTRSRLASWSPKGRSSSSSSTRRPTGPGSWRRGCAALAPRASPSST